MMCHMCGAWTRVRETRAFNDFTVKRVRVCANEHVFPTFEVTSGIYQDVAWHASQGYANTRLRLDKVKRNWSIKVAFDKQQRKNYSALARQFGLSDVRVKQILRELDGRINPGLRELLVNDAQPHAPASHRVRDVAADPVDLVLVQAE